VSGQLEPIVRDLMKKFDALDTSGMLAMFSDDVQGIDELSRKWIRSRSELEAYFMMLGGAVSDVTTEMSDVHERVWGDTGIVTAWAEQDYKLDGNPVHVAVPMTVVLRNEGGWKVALVSAVPLAPEE
jgi:ketosteroid isomerase-like protein